MAATELTEVQKFESKQAITDSLFKLLKKEKLEKIKVADVVKIAGVSRMAFYRNFKNIEDVIHQYFEPKLVEIFGDMKNDPSADSRYRKIGKFFFQSKDRLLLSYKSGFENIISDIFYQQLEAFIGKTDIQSKYWVKFYGAGIYAIWREWLLSDMDLNFDEINLLIHKFLGADYLN